MKEFSLFGMPSSHLVICTQMKEPNCIALACSNRILHSFEMPFNIWCNGCQAHIGKGVRYNAEKKSVGKYFSTKIWNFRMKCHLCDNYIEVQTDPQVTYFLLPTPSTLQQNVLLEKYSPFFSFSTRITWLLPVEEER